MKTKKVANVLIVSSLVLVQSFNSFAQKKFTFNRVSRDVKKEAKKYEKEGWKVEPGNLPIPQQLDAAFRKMAETSDEGFPKWIIANGSSLAQTQAAAEMQAMEVAKNRLVGLIQTNMKSVIESEVSNNQMDSKNAASLTQSIEISANRVSKKLGTVQPMFKVYKSEKNNTEVQVMIGYNYDMVRQQILDEAKAELANKGEKVKADNDAFFHPEKYNKGNISNYSEGETK